jgi:hypothetical protein
LNRRPAGATKQDHAVPPAKGGVRREESNGKMVITDQLFVSVTFKKIPPVFAMDVTVTTSTQMQKKLI